MEQFKLHNIEPKAESATTPGTYLHFRDEGCLMYYEHLRKLDHDLNPCDNEPEPNSC